MARTICLALMLAALLLVAEVAPARAQPAASDAARAGSGSMSSSSPPGVAGSGQNTFLGGVPSGTVLDTVVSLSLREAITRGLDHNLGMVMSRERAQSAEGTKWLARSGLLPNIAAHIIQSRQEINLAAYGFPVAPGQSPLIGPFNVSDRRISLTQALFDYGAFETARAGYAVEHAAQFAVEDARSNVVLLVSNLYLQVLAAGARIDSAKAQVRTAESLEQRAVDMKQAGMVSGVEVLRAQVQRQSLQQRVIVFENDLAKARLTLARAIGMPLGQKFELADGVPYKPLAEVQLDQALRQALASRPDYKSASALLKAAESARRAVVGEWLPSVHLSADYGDIGQSWGSAISTYTVGANVRIPLFQGGRIKGRRLQADAELAGQRAQLADLQARIEYEVRSALLDVTSSDDRVRVSRSAAELAEQQLTQTHDRFAAGVASQIEVVQAQEAVATASENLIASLYAHNLAKATLARALGIAEEPAERMLGGSTR
jgi:outer membrane protein TolC